MSALIAVTWLTSFEEEIKKAGLQWIQPEFEIDNVGMPMAIWRSFDGKRILNLCVENREIYVWFMDGQVCLLFPTEERLRAYKLFMKS